MRHPRLPFPASMFPITAAAPGSTRSAATLPATRGCASSTSSCSPPAGTCCGAPRSTTADADGTWSRQQRETYDRGNGATVLLYNRDLHTVLLTRQFRYPVYVNDHPDGMLIETAAGLLDDDDPMTAIRREAAEETGVEIGELQHVYDVYMSPGFGHRAHPLLRRARTTPSSRTGAGGGLGARGRGASTSSRSTSTSRSR